MTYRRLREFIGLALVAIAVPLIGWAFWAFVLRLGSNDFKDYWLAGKLLLQGRSPYDIHALSQLATSEGLRLTVGGGFSYPLPFAVAMVPLALLPYDTALLVFNGLSLACFGVTAAAWILWAHGGATRGGRLALALAAGGYAPIYGTIVNGQANLVLFPLLALGCAVAMRSHATAGFGGGVLIGLATIVKLVPGVVVVPLAMARRAAASLGLVAGAGVTLAASLALLPWAASGSGGLASLFDADGYYTNQSLNGFVTRLVYDTDRSVAMLPHAFDARPAMLVLAAALGVATLVVLWRARDRLQNTEGLALAIGLALVAGVAGAPKNSFWNQALALLAVGLLLAAEAPDLRLGRLGRLDLYLLGAWFATAWIWAAIWAINPVASHAGSLAPLVTLLWSTSLYGLIALWLLFARQLLRLQRGRAAVSPIH